MKLSRRSLLAAGVAPLAMRLWPAVAAAPLAREIAPGPIHWRRLAGDAVIRGTITFRSDGGEPDYYITGLPYAPK